MFFATRRGIDAASGTRGGRLAPPAARPFAHDQSGFDYFRSDYHHRYLVAAIARRLAKGHCFVLVTGEPGADGDLIARFLDEEKAKGYRARFMSCRPGMDFKDFVCAYGRQLGLKPEGESGGLWTLLSHLMLEVRNGITRVLVIEHADVLDERSFDELIRFTQLDDPHLMPVVLLAPPAFADRLEAPPLDLLRSAVAGRIVVDQLEPEEVGPFIQYQLNAHAEGDGVLFPLETVRTIAQSANGDPAIVNRLARQVILAAEGAEPETCETTPAAAPAPTELKAVTPEAAPVDATVAAEPELVMSEAAPVAAAVSEELDFEVNEAPPVAAAVAAEPEAEASEAAEVVTAVSAELKEAEELLRQSAERRETPSVVERLPGPVSDARDATRKAAPAAALPPRKRRRRQSTSGVAVGFYVGAAVLSGTALLYLLTPDAPRDAAPVTAVTVPLPESPSAAPAQFAVSPQAAEATGDSAAKVAVKELAPVPPPPRLEPSPPPASEAAITPAPPAAATAEAMTVPPPTPVAASTEPTRPPVPANEAAVVPAPIQAAASAASTEAPQAPAPASDAAIASGPTLPAASPTAVLPTTTASETRRETIAPLAPAVEPAPPQPALAAATKTQVAETPSATSERVAALPPSVASPWPREVESLPGSEVAALVQRGNQLLATGDIASARRFFERAAAAGDATAAFGLGKTFDPLYLRQVGARGQVGDAETASTWYRKAVDAGSAEAVARLQRLRVAYPQLLIQPK